MAFGMEAFLEIAPSARQLVREPRWIAQDREECSEDDLSLGE